MTSVPKDPTISELRELFRHLAIFRLTYHNTGLEEVITPLGNHWSIWDLEFLYEQSQKVLTLRQRQAIDMCLVKNIREQDAAVLMGVSPTNPVMMYATLGIRRLLDMIEAGDFQRFHTQVPQLYRQHRRTHSLERLAQTIQSRCLVDVNGCWVYPTNGRYVTPRVLIRTAYTSSGFMTIDPFAFMYEARRGPVPPNMHVIHVSGGLPSIACVNPDHGLLAIIHRETPVRVGVSSRHYQRAG